MKLLLVRHAIAESREIFAKTKRSDRYRPLSPRGRKRMRKNALGLAEILSDPNLLVTSPYTRAQETLKILKDVYPKTKTEALKELEPGASKESFLDWLKSNKKKKAIVAVGHEPFLGELASFLCSGSEKSMITLQKGGVCLLVFEGRIDKGRGKLHCLLTPSNLRRQLKTD